MTLCVKRLSFLVVLFCICLPVQSQLQLTSKRAIVLDSIKLKEIVANAEAVPLETLLNNNWVHTQSIIQYNNGFDEGPLYEVEDEMDYVYHFNEDGTYWIDAILDTDGTWSYDKEAKTFSIKSNFRSYISHSGPITFEDGILKWYELYDRKSKYWTIIVYVMEPEKNIEQN